LNTREIRQFPASSILLAGATFYAVSLFAYSSIGVAALVAVVVAATYYFNRKATAFVLSIMVFLVGLSSLSILTGPGLTLVAALATVAAILDFRDWLGALVGIILGLMLATPLVLLVAFPLIAALSLYRGTRTAIVTTIMFSLFGIFVLFSPSIGYRLPSQLYAQAFFPTTSTLKSSSASFILMDTIFGPNWTSSLQASSAGFLFDFTPLYFLVAALVLVYLVGYFRRLFGRLLVNLPLSVPLFDALNLAIATLITTLLFFNNAVVPLASLILSVQLVLAYAITRPLFAGKPKLVSRAVNEVVELKPMRWEKEFGKQDGLVVELHPGDSRRLKHYWESFIGPSSLKEELLQSATLTAHSRRETNEFGVKPTKGIIIFGPYGVGKTTLLRGLASKLDLSYFEFSPEEAMRESTRDASETIKNVFDLALRNSPCILVIDGIESVASTESANPRIPPRIRRAFLEAIESVFQSNANVILFATTESPKMLEPKLFAQGRFEKTVYLPPPNEAARVELFKRYLSQKKKVSPEIDYADLARLSEGLTGSDIERIVNKGLLAFSLPARMARRLAGSFGARGIEQDGSQLTQQRLEAQLKVTRPSTNHVMDVDYDSFRADFQQARRVRKWWGPDFAEVHFDDIGDLAKVKEYLKSESELLSARPELLKDLNFRSVKGILLYGPPGNGKTTLAKAIATEIPVNFFAVRGMQLAKGDPTEASAKLQQLFKAAKLSEPSIVFIDDLHLMAPDRKNLANAAQIPVTTELMNQLDGLKNTRGVLVLAAADNLKAIDKDLLDTNRLEKQIYVPLPDEKAREQILKVMLRNVKFGRKFSVKEIAKLTEGFSGLDLQQLVNEAKEFVLKDSLRGVIRESITFEDFKKAIEKKIFETGA
jgi:transitional endoplasmic reticulum ATPase